MFVSEVLLIIYSRGSNKESSFSYLGTKVELYNASPLDLTWKYNLFILFFVEKFTIESILVVSKALSTLTHKQFESILGNKDAFKKEKEKNKIKR